MARVRWFVVRNAAGVVVYETTELAAALQEKRRFAGRTLEGEWRAAASRLERAHKYGGEA